MNDRTSSDVSRNLAQVMHAHDGEAPSTAELLTGLRDAPRPEPSAAWSRGRRRFIPLAAGAAVAAVIAGSVWGSAQLSGAGRPSRERHHAAVSPLACPARYSRAAPWVPARAHGVSARSRLVPPRTPASALICAYDGSNIGRAAGWRLSERRVLSGGLAALAKDLTWAARRVPGQSYPCTTVGGSQVNYLLGLTYPGGGRLWVAATTDPNDCIAASNGAFISYPGDGPLLARALSSGRWPHRGPASCRGPETAVGRLGQDRAMVPAGAVSVSICGDHGGLTLNSGLAALVSALDKLPTTRSTRQCSMTPRHRGKYYALVFGYREGPGVQVIVNSGCVPAIDNGSLQAGSARTIVPIIVALER